MPSPHFMAGAFFGLIGTKSTSLRSIRRDRGCGGVIVRDEGLIPGIPGTDLGGDCSTGVEEPLKDEDEKEQEDTEVAYVE